MTGNETSNVKGEIQEFFASLRMTAPWLGLGWDGSGWDGLVWDVRLTGLGG
jgi:hypothetical protein